MGRSVKDKNRLKKMFLGSMQKYCKQLEEENKALRDPKTLIGRVRRTR